MIFFMQHKANYQCVFRQFTFYLKKLNTKGSMCWLFFCLLLQKIIGKQKTETFFSFQFPLKSHMTLFRFGFRVEQLTNGCVFPQFVLQLKNKGHINSKVKFWMHWERKCHTSGRQSQIPTGAFQSYSLTQRFRDHARVMGCFVHVQGT